MAQMKPHSSRAVATIAVCGRFPRLTIDPLRSDGSIVGWGSNSWGELDAPPLPSGVTYQKLAAGGHHTLAVRSDGMLLAWGDNSDGQSNVPTLPAGLSYVDCAAGYYHSLALCSDGSLIGFGRNEYGQSTPPTVPPGVSVLKMSAGRMHSAIFTSDSVITAWGHNYSGQCNVPTLPPSMSFVDMSSGEFHMVSRVEGVAPAPSSYCTAKLNSLGCLPSVGFSGTPSLAGADDFVASASNILNYHSGILFWGRAPTAIPFQGGTLCIAPPILRTRLQDSGGNTGVNDCSGNFSFHVSHAFLAGNGFAIGSELYAQFWSRDQFSPPFFTSLSDGLHAWIAP